MPHFEIRLLATGVIALVAVGLSIFGRRLDQDDAVFENVLVTVLLLVVVWLPRTYRDYGIVAIIALLALAGGPISALVAGAVTYGIVAMLPGGGTGLLLGGLGILAYSISREERQRLAMVKKAKLLVPGESRAVECAVVGPARSVTSVKRPDDDKTVAAWWVSIERDDDREDNDGLATHELRSSRDEFEVDTGEGTAKVSPSEVDLTNAGLGWSALESAEQEDKEVFDKVAAQLELDPGPIETLRITSIDNEASLFVLGTPTWEADPSAGRGYRESAFVPVFRGEESKRLVLKRGTLSEIKRRITFSSAMWGVWAVPCVAIAVLQFGFGL